MGIQTTDATIVLGMVTNQPEAMFAFYGDTLGFAKEDDISFPGIGTISRFDAGDLRIRILVPEKPTPSEGSRDGFMAQTGYRYVAINIANLEETVESCRARGYKIPVEIMDLRPGIRVAQVEDPDGNTIEFMEHA